VLPVCFACQYRPRLSAAHKGLSYFLSLAFPTDNNPADIALSYDNLPTNRIHPAVSLTRDDLPPSQFSLFSLPRFQA
jgi:hypothetical protein